VISVPTLPIAMSVLRFEPYRDREVASVIALIPVAPAIIAFVVLPGGSTTSVRLSSSAVCPKAPNSPRASRAAATGKMRSGIPLLR